MADTPSALYRLLFAQAKKRPDSIALLAPGRKPLSYRRLALHVEETVRTLNGLGIGRNDRVAIALANGPEMAMAFLTVAAGASSAPLNPAYRAEEFAFYLSDLAARALVVESGVDSPARAVARERGIPIVELEPLSEGEAGTFRLLEEGASRPRRPRVPGLAGSGDVALVLHTSGTTSRPKIVALTHANLYASARNMRSALELDETDRCLNVMPLFHAHGLVLAVLTSLTAGASVVCTPGFYAPRFFSWLAEFRPTWYTAAPALHQAILARGETYRGDVALRFIRSSAAPMPPQVMAELEELFGAPVIESYGMTESAVQVTSNPLPPRTGGPGSDVAKRRKPGSAGVAAGTEIAILDEAGERVAPGVVGEIVIRGENVTEGYADNPAANAEAFIHGWLRTGDQGYLDDEGFLFITGRIKEIINRGGEKVSPREVEEVLMDHPAVAQAVTFAVPDRELGEQVAAAVVLRGTAEPREPVTEREIREFVAARLVDFKVPRRVVFLDRIPKGPTGKPRRLGLAEELGIVAPPAPKARTDFAPPRTKLEKTLAAIWRDVLGLDKVGRNDPFPQCGGDSVLAARIILRVRELTGMELPMLSFFDREPTVASMAKTMASCPGRSDRVAPISASPSEEPAPLSFNQERFWFLEQLRRGSVNYNVPYSAELLGSLRVAALEASFREIEARHEVLRTSFPGVRGRPVPHVSAPAPRRLPVVDLAGLSESARRSEAARLATGHARRPFDLQRGPLMRTTLVRLAENRHTLLVNLHHIVVDGWSLEVLIRELSAIYGAFARGRASPLLPLPVQYRDYARWQRRRWGPEAVEEEIPYWRRRLGAEPPVLRLPGQRQATGALLSAHAVCDLAPELVGALNGLAQRCGVSLFMTLLAAYAALLGRYSGQSKLIVGTVAANRGQVEVEGLIGCFVNTLPLVVDLAGDPGFEVLLERVRRVTLEAHEHQDLPFEKLVDAYNPDRRNLQPLFQAFFQVMKARPPLDLVGVAERPSDLSSGRTQSTQFDLAMIVAETPEGLSAGLFYNAVPYPREWIKRLLADFRGALTRITEEPSVRVSELAGPSETERLALEGEAAAARPRPGSDASAGEERFGSRQARLARKLGAVPALRDGLRRRLQMAKDGAETGREIPKRAAAEATPLSFSQERLWFLDKLEPGSLAYTIPFVVRLSGRLDVFTLERSLAEILRRHEVLRTVFETSDESPRQRVLEPAQRALPVVDLEGLATAARAQAHRLSRLEVRRPFDLSRGPLFRYFLLRLAERDCRLVFQVHHIVFDAWSKGVVVRDLSRLYEALGGGRPAPLEEPPIQYGDFAVWQRQRLRGEHLESRLAYWRRQLSDVPMLELATDRPRSASSSRRGSRMGGELPEKLGLALEALARRRGATLFMVLLAAFQALLSRYTGQTDFAVGTPISGRTRRELEGLIGFFVNTVVLRADLADAPSFDELLGRAREATLAAHAHQELPFEKLVAELQPRRELAHTPFFRVMLSFDDTAPAMPELPGLDCEVLPEESGEAKLDLTLLMAKGEGPPAGTWVYRTALFDRTTVRRLHGHFQAVLEAAAADPARPVAELTLMRAPERQQVVLEWRAVPAEAGRRPADVGRRFEACAEELAEAVAVVFEDERWSYRGLDRRSDRLARLLRGLGVGPGVVAALGLERSAAVPAAFFGVLKAGGAYLPLDPEQPEERLKRAVAEARATVLLTDSRLAAVFGGAREGGAPRIVRLDADTERLAAAGGAGPVPVARPEDLAYVLYTSGSTGRPKGVAIERRQLASYVEAVIERLGPVSAARWATVSTFAADLGNTAIFPALVTGGTLHVVPSARAVDAEALAEHGRRERIDYLKIVPSHLEALSCSPRFRDLLPRRVLVLGGEPAPWSLVERVAALAPDCRIVNHYGPTETTVGVLTSPAVPRRRSAAAWVPLGRPLAGVLAHVTDAGLRPVPAGLAGELAVGGATVGRGYLRRPGPTAERFVPDPLATAPGTRLYRTGDLVRRLADGAVDFLGRADRQVKIRGFRIELGEIEAVLRQSAAVHEAVVVARDEAPGGGAGGCPVVGPGIEVHRQARDRDLTLQPVAGPGPDGG